MANLIRKGIDFVSGSYEELKKVSTPSFDETKRATIMTVVIVLLVAVIIMILDLIFNNVSKIIMPS